MNRIGNVGITISLSKVAMRTDNNGNAARAATNELLEKLLQELTFDISASLGEGLTAAWGEESEVLLTLCKNVVNAMQDVHHVPPDRILVHSTNISSALKGALERDKRVSKLPKGLSAKVSQVRNLSQLIPKRLFKYLLLLQLAKSFEGNNHASPQSQLPRGVQVDSLVPFTVVHLCQECGLEYYGHVILDDVC